MHHFFLDTLYKVWYSPHLHPPRIGPSEVWTRRSSSLLPFFWSWQMANVKKNVTRIHNLNMFYWHGSENNIHCFCCCPNLSWDNLLQVNPKSTGIFYWTKLRRMYEKDHKVGKYFLFLTKLYHIQGVKYRYMDYI